MRKVYTYFFPALLATLTLTGCGSSGDEPEAPARSDCPDFTATIDNVHARAFDRSWESGDLIGISGCGRSNVCYLTDKGDGVFTVQSPGEQIYFQNDGEETFTAYYPWTVLSGDAVIIDADTKLQNRQKDFDFLWAQASGKKDAPEVAFSFAHKMSKVFITVRTGTDISFEELKEATLSLVGVCHSGSFNTADGSASVNSSGEAWDINDFAVFNEVDNTVTFSLIFFPQSFENPLEFRSVMKLSDNNPLSLKANIDFTNANREMDGDNAKNEWVAGRQYNLSFTLNKTDISISECVIIGWNEVKGDDITVE